MPKRGRGYLRSRMANNRKEAINMAFDMNCAKCDYYRGHPNKRNKNGQLIFICSKCEDRGR